VNSARQTLTALAAQQQASYQTAEQLKSATPDRVLRATAIASGLPENVNLTALMTEQDEQLRTFVMHNVYAIYQVYPDAGLQSVAFDTMMIGWPNAVAIHAPDGSYGIGMDPRLHSLFSLLYVWAVVAHQTQDFRVFSSGVEGVAGAFHGQDLSLVHLEEFKMLHELLAKSAESVREMHELFTEAAVRFLLAHELGHIALGHLTGSTSGSGARLVLADGRDAEISSFDSHAKEYAADSWAFGATLRSCGANYKRQTLAAAAPQLLFVILAFLELHLEPRARLEQLLQTSHPKATDRAAHIGSLAAKQSWLAPNNATAYLSEVTHFLWNNRK
jgi:hypothetical protein